MRRGESIDKILMPLSDDRTSQGFLSDYIQVADILEWILAQTGAAEVWQTSFSVSDEFLRRLFFIRKKHSISRFTLILDHKATNKTIKLWPFMRQVVEEILLADNHSKVMIVIPAAPAIRPVAVITSQNLTRGNRFESSLITQDNVVFKSIFNALRDMSRNHSVPLNELFARLIDRD